MRTNLINSRKQNNFTQVSLATAIGISERQYQYLEAGTSNGSIETWLKLKQIVGQTIDYLIDNDTTKLNKNQNI